MDPKRRTVSLIAAILLVAGASVWGLARLLDRQRAAEAAIELQRDAELLGQELDGASEAAHLRAEALAALPVVRAAIETDVATVKDLDRSNNLFSPAPGEALELHQLGAHPLSLVRAPESAHPLKLDANEVQLAEDGEALAVTVSARVMPMYEAGKKGAMAVRRRVALDGLKRELEAHGLAAVLTGLEGPLLLKAGPPWSLRAKVPFERQALTLQASRLESGTGALGVFGVILIVLAIVGALGALAWPRPRAARGAAERTTGVTPVIPPRERVLLIEAHTADELDALPQLVPMQPEPPTRGEVPADRLVAGRYRVIQPLGNGAESEVYLAQTVQQVGVPKVVALKLLHPQAQLGADAFLEALQAAARVQGTNVVRVHDHGIDEQRFFVAMEYVEGCSAACLLRELRSSHETMPLKQSLAIAIGTCKALEAAHGARVGGLPAPVLHRDLRPSSILIGRHGAVKLSDFGSARPRLTAFTAPELARGGAADVRADLYSLGMILNELVAGVSLPRSLEAVIIKATQANPRRRYASAQQLRADLEDVAEAVAEPPSSGVLGDWVERVRRSHAQ